MKKMFDYFFYRSANLCDPKKDSGSRAAGIASLLESMIVLSIFNISIKLFTDKNNLKEIMKYATEYIIITVLSFFILNFFIYRKNQIFYNGEWNNLTRKQKIGMNLITVMLLIIGVVVYSSTLSLVYSAGV